MFLFLRLLRWVVILVVAAGAAIGATLWLFVLPTNHEPRQAAAAVVVLEGGTGERLDEAIGLMRLGVAPTLVVYGGRADRFGPGRRVCRGDADFAVLCPPARRDARAEARALGKLAADRGWRSLVVVTSTYGVSRTRLLVESCVPGRVQVVGSRPPAGAWALAIPREWKGYLNALVAKRDC